jgi:uncharacterized protein YfiM (DUF2279 family)
MLRVLWRLAIVFLVAAPLALLGGALLAFSRTPAVQSSDVLTPEMVGRAERLLRRHNPRWSRDGQIRTAEIEAGDVRLMAGYAASRVGVAMDVRIQDGEAVVRASVPIPRSPIGGYLNVRATFEDSSGVPHPTRMRIGHLPVPDVVATWLIRQVARRFYHPDSEQVAAEMIRSVSMHPDRLRIEYQWSDDAADRMRAMAVSAEDAARFRAYHDRLVSVTGAMPQSHRSLVDLLGPVMQLAADRSAGGADPVVENRAAIMVVALYINGIGMAAVVPGAEAWPRPRRRGLLLQGRGDLTQHFTVSALLAAAAGTPLAHVVGLYKEIADSRGGSGFSFSDLAADRAGTLFGELAVTSAAALQRGVRSGLAEGDVMPDITGLADGLPEAEFIRQFGGVDSPEYARVVQEIDRRVAQCRLFKALTEAPTQRTGD